MIGDLGWYDYTMASPEYTEEQLDAMTMGWQNMADKLFNQWTTDNRSQTKRCLRQLEEQLEACGDLPILAVTHMLPVDEFLVCRRHREV